MNRIAFGASCKIFADNPTIVSISLAMNNSYAVLAFLNEQGQISTSVASLANWPNIQFSPPEIIDNYLYAGTISIDVNTHNEFVMAYSNTHNKLCVKSGTVSSSGVAINHVEAEQQVGDNTIVQCSVALNDQRNLTILFQKGTSIYYVRGTMNSSSKATTWQSSHPHGDGVFPQVTSRSDGYTLEVHQSEDFSSNYYTLWPPTNETDGKFPETDSHEYEGQSKHSPSTTPCIVMNNNNQILEVHRGYDNNNSLHSLNYIQLNINSSGALNINYQQPYYFESSAQSDTAQRPVVALNDNGYAIQMYLTLNDELYGCISQIRDRSNWMSGYQDKKLLQISMPGSHDAAMSTTNNCYLGADRGNTVTQIKRISDQLESGVRYFDIRPVFVVDPTFSFIAATKTGHFSGGHGFVSGCFGQEMDTVLSDVKSFLESTTSETVILKFSHFMATTGIENQGLFFSDISATHKQSLITSLVNTITTALGSSKIYTAPNGTRLVNSYVRDCAKKAIILFDIADLNGVSYHSESGIHSYLDLYVIDDDGNQTDKKSVLDADIVVFDRYTNTNSVNVMKNASAPNNNDPEEKKHPGQEYLITQPDNHDGDLFLLSWTLTLQGFQVVDPTDYKILQLSQFANGVLLSEMISMHNAGLFNSTVFPSIIYVDAADGFVTDVCLWINSLRLR